MAVHNQRGKDAERLAEAYLLNKGYVLIERNYRCKVGEIDLVMRDKNALVFVEVRSSRLMSGWVTESVGFKKQLKLRRTSERWFLLNTKHHSRFNACRFDLVLVFDEALEHRVDVMC